MPWHVPPSSETGKHKRVGGFLKWMASLFDWRPVPYCIPRAACHRLRIPLKGVPKRLHTPTIRLQILNLSGLQKFGFAWRLAHEEAEVWYWDEADMEELPGFPAAEARLNGVRPAPEVLFRRNSLNDGLHLLVCTTGYEATACERGETLKTRWYSAAPGHEDWLAFVRDSGKIPDQHPQPMPTMAPLLVKPSGQWQIHSNFLHGLPADRLVLAAGILIGGAVLAGLLSYDIKYSHLIAKNRHILEQLKSEKNVVIDLQDKIARHTIMLDAVSDIRPKALQLQLMQALAETGLFEEGKGISLSEWEYRNDRLRLLFMIPRGEFSLTTFLSTIEAMELFSEIRLIPDTPPQTVGIQALVNAPGERPARVDWQANAGKN